MGNHSLCFRIQWIFSLAVIHLFTFTYILNVICADMCNQRLQKRELMESKKSDKKPCCLPSTWKSRFVVHSVLVGKQLSRVDHGAFRVRRRPDGSVANALLVVGKSVSSPEFCFLTIAERSNVTKTLCPNDRVACLQAPFLGEPRCLTTTNGYHLKRTHRMDREGRVRQAWFIDRVNRLHGSVERHIYQVVRQYGFCQLVQYQVQWGNYVRPWRSCRLLVRMEQTYRPVKGSFSIQVEPEMTEKLLFC
ncbi:unnamed protein product [Calicophoron daubneyi]|uniref:Uncharacterized protein n=1 Tax=Calicophoron daubneyi TaxID=300641 RepID=A0AAV2TEN6_CALDB